MTVIQYHGTFLTTTKEEFTAQATEIGLTVDSDYEQKPDIVVTGPGAEVTLKPMALGSVQFMDEEQWRAHVKSALADKVSSAK